MISWNSTLLSKETPSLSFSVNRSSLLFKKKKKKSKPIMWMIEEVTKFNSFHDDDTDSIWSDGNNVMYLLLDTYVKSL